MNKRAFAVWLLVGILILTAGVASARKWSVGKENTNNWVRVTDTCDLILGNNTLTNSMTSPYLFVEGTSEYDARAYFDAGATLGAALVIADDINLALGTDSDAILQWDTAGQDELFFGLGDSEMIAIFGQKADANATHSWVATNQTNPTVYVALADDSLATAITGTAITLGNGEGFDNATNGVLATTGIIQSDAVFRSATTNAQLLDLYDASANVALDVATGNDFVVTLGNAANFMQVAVGGFRAGTGTPGVATGAGDIYATSDIEGDALLNIAGASTLTGLITGGAGLTLTGTATLNDAVILGNGATDQITFGGNIFDGSNVTFGTDSDATVQWDNTNARLALTASTVYTSAAFTATGLITGGTGLTLTGTGTFNDNVVLGSSGADTLTFNGRVPDGSSLTFGADGDVGVSWDNTLARLNIGGAVNTTGASTMAALTASGLITGQAALTLTGTATLNDAVILGSSGADSLTVNARLPDAGTLVFGTDGDVAVSWNQTSAYLNIGGATNITGTSTVVALTASGLITGNAALTISSGLSSVQAITAAGVATFNGDAVFNSSAGLANNIELALGTAQDAALKWSTTQPASVFGVDTTSNYIVFGQLDDDATDLAIPNQTGPTIAIANAAWTGYALYNSDSITFRQGEVVDNNTNGDITITGDIAASGGGFREVYQYKKLDIGDNWTDAAAETVGSLTGVVNVNYTMERAGSIIGLAVASSAVITTGTITFEVAVNGVETGFIARLDATGVTQYPYNTQAKDADSFAAGDRLTVTVTSTNPMAPEAMDAMISVIVEK